MIALELLAATLFSSLVGSMHCVGMCTPFAILAMGQSTPCQKGRWVRLISYHLGRLTTYLMMALGVVCLSLAFQRMAGGSQTLRMIGWGVGITMIVMGVFRLMATFSLRLPVKHSRFLNRWTSAVVKLRRSYSKGPVWLGSFLWGLTSTLLPCGWLYVFVLASAAAPNAVMTVAMMTAFWFGTLPLLSVAAWSWSSISPSWQVLAQPFAAGCIISFGAFILVQRSLVDMRPLNAPSSGLLELQQSRGSEIATGQSPENSLEMAKRSWESILPWCRGDDARDP